MRICLLYTSLGFAYLLIRRVVTWQTPVCFVGTVFLMSLILGQDALAQVLSGGLLLGAIFMATDYSTSPCTAWGKVCLLYTSHIFIPRTLIFRFRSLHFSAFLDALDIQQTAYHLGMGFPLE